MLPPTYIYGELHHNEAIKNIVDKTPHRGDGVNTQVKDIITNLNTKRESIELKNLEPKIEIIKKEPTVNVEDTRKITEDQIVENIIAEWGETLDTLVPTQITYLESSKGLLITMSFESTKQTEEGENVMYQFTRKGTYGKDDHDVKGGNGEFTATEIIRIESKPKNKPNNKGGILELVGVTENPIPLDNSLPERPLEDNEFELDGNKITVYRKKL